MNFKIKQRFVSLLLCGAMLFSLCPVGAFAVGEGTNTSKAIQLGTGGITSYDYIYFGYWDGQNSEADSGSIKWRVLDAKQGNAIGAEDKLQDAEGNSVANTNAMFLLSEDLLGNGEYGSVYFDKTSPYSNAWQGSDAQEWCSDFYSSNLTSQEQSAVLATTKSDEAYTSNNNIRFAAFEASENILSKDKVFFLSAEEAESSTYGFEEEAARVAKYGTSAEIWWLRSPYEDSTHNFAGMVYKDGSVNGGFVNSSFTVRPAFNLNLNSILFTSAAVGSKEDATVDQNLTSVGTGAGAREWKLTLKDSDRNFSVTSSTTVTAEQGSTIDVAYAGAKLGDKEYVSAMIVQNDTVLYYGRIVQNSESGTASITIPADLAVGSYTLKVFSEQCNGDYQTDYASAFVDIALTVVPDKTPPALSGGKETRSSESTATVTFTSSEAGTYYYVVVASGATVPSDLTTSSTSGDCVKGENTISLENLSAGKKDIYIVAKDAAGNISDLLKIVISASALSVPTNLTWNSDTPSKATWNAVAGASDYSVQLYKDGGAQGKVVSVNEAEHTFKITEEGIYTFKVKATNSAGTYTDSDEAESGKLFTVSFETNGAGTVDMQLVADGGQVTEPAAPTKTGYTFAGWYSDASLTDGNKWEFASDTISGTMTLYAKWNANSYKVTLNTNDGTINGGDISGYTYGTGAMLPSDVTREGYTFAGWYADEKCEGEEVKTIGSTETGDKAFYAKWTANSYSVTLHTNEGTINSGNISGYTYGTGATLPSDVTREGYTFAGWYADEKCEGEEVKTIGSTETGNKAFYAKWTANSYTVTVQKDGNGTASADPATATAGTTITLTATPNSGCHFVRWEVVSGDVTITDDNTFTMPAGNVEVRAVFSAHQAAEPDKWEHDSSQHWKVCSECNERFLVENHNLKQTPAKDATCTEAGNIEYWHCDVCGTYFKDEAATQEITQGETVIAAGHTLDYVAAKAATHTEDGNIEYWYCAVCDVYFADAAATKEITQEEIVTAKIPHTYDTTTWEQDETSHWHECTCGAVADKAEHTPGPDATEASPQTCTECGRVLKPALEHTHQYGEEWEQDDSGHWHKCACGAETAKAPHDFGSWVETKPATETEAGSKERSCQTCGYTVTEEIPQLDPDRPDTPDEPETPIDPETPEYREEYQLKQDGLGAQVLEQFRDVPGIETVEDVAQRLNDELTRVMAETTQPGEAEPQTALFDVRLQVKRNGEWEDVHADDFPEEGILVWLCDLVPDVDQETHSFVVTHMLATDRDDKKAGEVETLTLAQGQRGLYFVVYSLSPIGVAWTENTAEPEKSVQPASGGDTEALIGAAVVIGGGAAWLAYQYREALPIWKLAGVVTLADEAATPVADATVALYQEGEAVKTLTTDADGHFAARLPKGTYEAVVTWEKDGVAYTARETLTAESVWEDAATVQKIVLTEQTGE